MTSIDPPSDLDIMVSQALAEDVGDGDITAQLIAEEVEASANIVARESAILCGIPWAEAVFRKLSDTVEISWHISEGNHFDSGETIATVSGNARAIMTGERSALNFLQTLSGTATRAHELAKLVQHTQVKLLDTRKTLPGLRSAQKYAVRIGGGQNHRMGLFDAFLIKENHIAAGGGIEQAISQARMLAPGKPVEIEVQTLGELELAISAGTDIVMLDNFDLENTAKAVAINDGQAKLEASGGIDKQALVSIAETGVDYISIGALTKHCRAIDLSLLINSTSLAQPL